MIDGFVLLAPLILLPIILLFVFIGCTLDTTGAQVAVRLVYGPGFETDIESIEVKFEFNPVEPLSHLVAIETLTHDEILPEGNSVVKETLVSLGDEGEIECTCVITKMQTPEPIFCFESIHKARDEDVERFFQLSREGDDFSLKVAWVEYVGGGI
jgi:hypothetical protein